MHYFVLSTNFNIFFWQPQVAGDRFLLYLPKKLFPIAFFDIILYRHQYKISHKLTTFE